MMKIFVAKKELRSREENTETHPHQKDLGLGSECVVVYKRACAFQNSNFFDEVLKEGSHHKVSILGFGGVNLWVMALFLTWGFGYQHLD